MTIFNNNDLTYIIIFFIPGFISIKVYDLLIAGEPRDFSKSMLDAIAFSAVNLGLLSWLIYFIDHYHILQKDPIISAVLIFFILFIAPIAWPISYLFLINRGWLSEKIIPPVKRPWDWFFRKQKSYWVIVTLKNGQTIGGVYSAHSYASSFPLPEQIYLEEIWKIDSLGQFIEVVERSKGAIKVLL